jgi:uncharacterized protein
VTVHPRSIGLAALSKRAVRLEIDAEVPGGLNRTKIRILLENANTLGFIGKAIR